MSAKLWWQNIKESLVPLFKNKSVLIVLGFFLWIGACDKDSMIDYISLKSKISSLEKEKAQMVVEIEQDKRKMEELQSNRENLEKFAREQYFMKRDDEEIFIVK